MRTPSIIVLLIFAFLGGVAAYVVSVIRQAEPAVKAECVDLDLQDQIRKLALEGFERGFVARAQHLFDTWTIDDPKNHPQRAQVGMQNAIHAFIYARELANNWSAPPCPVGVGK